MGSLIPSRRGKMSLTEVVLIDTLAPKINQQKDHLAEISLRFGSR
jgi:hypothetical protein